MPFSSPSIKYIIVPKIIATISTANKNTDIFALLAFNAFTRLFDAPPDPTIDGRRNHLKQIHLSSAWHLTKKLRVVGKVEYDIQRKNLVNVLGGFELYGCCVDFRALVMRTRTSLKGLSSSRKYESTFGLQMVFKGFAGVGSAAPGLIGAGIPGYELHRDTEF